MGLHRRRVWEIAKGFRGRARNCIKIARQQAEKALQHAYKGRRDKKMDMRALWISRVNAATREHGLKYSLFMAGLRQENVRLNRKMLSELAIFEPHSFKALVEQVQFMRGASGPSSSSSSSSRSSSSSSSSIAARLTVAPLDGGGGGGGGGGGSSAERERSSADGSKRSA
ncbi:rplT [Scenedesmus sp. PABB004]|nr:rplT [Scenedesmus sp. PABB004]